MAINRETFISKYIDEIQDNVTAIDSCIVILKKDPGNEDVMNTLLRTLHTIKGSSRMLKFNTIEKIAHGMENVCKGIKEGRYEIDKDIIKLVFITTDYIALCLDSIKETKTDDVQVNKLLAIFDKVYANEHYSLDELQLDKSEIQKQEIAIANKDQHVSIVLPDSGSENVPSKAAREETVRINLSKINAIIKQINNVVVRQFQFKTGNDLMREIEEGFGELLIYHKAKSKKIEVDVNYEKSVNNLLKKIQK